MAGLDRTSSCEHHVTIFPIASSSSLQLKTDGWLRESLKLENDHGFISKDEYISIGMRHFREAQSKVIKTNKLMIKMTISYHCEDP